MGCSINHDFSDYTELRPLGVLEKYSYVRSELGIYNNVCVTATFRRQDQEPLREALTRALAVVVAGHPILSGVPVGDLSAPRFLLLPSIDTDKILTIERLESGSDQGPTAHWDEIVQHQHNTPFEHKSPLVPFWRLHVVESGAGASQFTLCLCFHHALADTRSSLVFLQDLERALSHPLPIPASSFIPASTKVVLPAMEALHTFPLSPEFVARQNDSSLPSPSTWSGLPQTLPVKTNFASVWVSSELTSRLVRMARGENSSLTGILMSLLAAACFNVLPPEYTEINGDCAISLREFLLPPITSNSIGCYVGSFSQSYDRSSSSIWEDARRTKRIIRAMVANGAPNMPATYLKTIPDMASWFNGKFGTKRTAAWEISNVGALGQSEGDKAKDTGYRIESLLFSQSSSACSGAIKLSAATGRDGRLSLGFTWQQGIVEAELVQGVMRNVVELVELELAR